MNDKIQTAAMLIIVGVLLSTIGLMSVVLMPIVWIAEVVSHNIPKIPIFSQIKKRLK